MVPMPPSGRNSPSLSNATTPRMEATGILSGGRPVCSNTPASAARTRSSLIRRRISAPTVPRNLRRCFQPYRKARHEENGAAMRWSTAVSSIGAHLFNMRCSWLCSSFSSSVPPSICSFWTVVQPVNADMMRWPLDAIPRHWAKWRDRWEYGHAVRAGLVTVALGILTWSLLGDACEDGSVEVLNSGLDRIASFDR
jgi:hypothetical protein